jgi:hypothetical protein
MFPVECLVNSRLTLFSSLCPPLQEGRFDVFSELRKQYRGDFETIVDKTILRRTNPSPNDSPILSYLNQEAFWDGQPRFTKIGIDEHRVGKSLCMATINTAHATCR